MPHYKITHDLEAQVLDGEQWRPLFRALEVDTELGVAQVAQLVGPTQEVLGQMRVVDVVTGEVNPGGGTAAARTFLSAAGDPITLLAGDPVDVIVKEDLLRETRAQLAQKVDADWVAGDLSETNSQK